ncbi:hypothetical protein [Amycolatopsis anabasis]|uniref:hypothetical protein n=1 Tax=Amycolatopsis anabasis TaxID=1840409 RepID=UPI00131C15ED|nr:hypothetical protein [Amycolatopsis anabasis]
MAERPLPGNRTDLLALARQAGVPRAQYLTTGELRDALRRHTGRGGQELRQDEQGRTQPTHPREADNVHGDP